MKFRISSRLMVAVVSICIAFTGCTQTKNSSIGEVVFENEELSITQLEENMWVVETFDMTTMYIIEGKRYSALIDTGTTAKDLDDIVAGITDKPLKIILTHVHPDHAGNIEYFPEIYFHPADTVLMGVMGNPEYGGKVNFINDGDIIDLGGVRLNVALMPGHTPGSIVLNDYKSGNCYSGDAFGSGQVWLQVAPVSPMATYVKSCERMIGIMETKGIERLYCGHYPYSKITYGIDYVKAMKTLGEQVIAREADMMPFVNPLYPDSTEIKTAVNRDNGVMIVFNETLID